MAKSPSDDRMEVRTPAQFKALGHQFRQRLVFALGEPATISQLAARLDTKKGNVAHHLNVLSNAGLVRVVGTKQVRGGTEKYYARSARRLDVTSPEAGQAAALVGAFTAELTADDEHLLAVRHVRLTEQQAARLRAQLSASLDDLEPAADDQPRFGVLVGMYEEHTEPSG